MLEKFTRQFSWPRVSLFNGLGTGASPSLGSNKALPSAGGAAQHHNTPHRSARPVDLLFSLLPVTAPKQNKHLPAPLSGMPLSDARNRHLTTFGPVGYSESLRILNSTGGDFMERYKILMRLNHPDRGGSPFLCMKINEAKSFLSEYHGSLS